MDNTGKRESKMKKIILIGDSIRMGYDKYVSFECGCNGDREILVPAAVELLRSQWEQAV